MSSDRRYEHSSTCACGCASLGPAPIEGRVQPDPWGPGSSKPMYEPTPEDLAAYGPPSATALYQRRLFDLLTDVIQALPEDDGLREQCEAFLNLPTPWLDEL